LGSFKTTAVNAKVLTKTTASWLKSGGTSRASSFSVGTPPASSFSTGTIKTQKPFSKPAPTPTRTIVFKTKAPVTKTPVKGIFSPTNWGKPTPYVAPKPKQGTWVAAKKSSGSGSSGGGGPPIGTFHPDSANIAAQKNPLLRSKNIGTGGKVTY